MDRVGQLNSKARDREGALSGACKAQKRCRWGAQLGARSGRMR